MKHTYLDCSLLKAPPGGSGGKLKKILAGKKSDNLSLKAQKEGFKWSILILHTFEYKNGVLMVDVI